MLATTLCTVPRARSITVFALTLGLSVISDAAADAESILLKNGRQLQGKVVRRPTAENDVYVIRLATNVLVRLDSDDVGRVEELRGAASKYAKLLPNMPDTAQGHFKMAQWCHNNELKDQKQLHLEQVIRHDPDHADARKMLGQSFVRGKWGKSQDHMEAQGYERHRGSLRLPMQIELERKQEAVELAQKKWRKTIGNKWRRWLNGSQVDLARQNILAINDPLAAPALRELLQKESVVAVRELYIDALANLNDVSAIKAMAERALYDGDLELRLRSIEHLRRRPSPIATRTFVQALGSNENRTVRRAGVALGRLGDPQAVRPLIEALVTTHQSISKPTPQITPSFGGSSDGGSGFNGLNVGGGPKKVTRQVNNQAVLDALVALTGKNFRFSIPNWRRWYVEQNSLPDDINLRRDG